MATTTTPRAPRFQMAQPKRRQKEADKNRVKHYQLNLRLSDFGKVLLQRIAAKHGLNMTSALEYILRDQARKEGVYDVEPGEHHTL